MDKIERGVDYGRLVPYSKRDRQLMRRGLSEGEKCFIHEIKKAFPGSEITHAWPNHSFYEDDKCHKSTQKEKEPIQTKQAQENVTSSMFDDHWQRDYEKRLERKLESRLQGSTSPVTSQRSSKNTLKKLKKKRDYKSHLFK